MELLLFLFKVFLISFSGAMQPGPVTATAIVIGGRNRYAGILLAVGHIIVEFPLMILILLGMGRLFELSGVQIGIGLAGGIVLLIMAAQMFVGSREGQPVQYKALDKKPILAGMILSASNPYFLLWWATIGLALASDAQEFGIWAFVLFSLVHWLCDCVWVEALSLASFKGSVLLGRHKERIVLSVCGAAMFLFGVKFIYTAIRGIV